MTDAYAAFPSLELDRPAPHVLRLTLRAPGQLNAVSGTMHRELAARLARRSRDDDETRAVIVRGADGAFSAGGDLDLVLEIADDHETRLRVFHEARDLVYNVDQLPEADRLGDDRPRRRRRAGRRAARRHLDRDADGDASSTATRRLGVAAGDHAAIVWPLLCGMAKAKYHLLLCEPVDGVEAERIGLVSLCVPEEELEERALAIATRLAEGSQPALRHTKLALNNWLRARGAGLRRVARARVPRHDRPGRPRGRRRGAREAPAELRLVELDELDRRLRKPRFYASFRSPRTRGRRAPP